MILNDFLMKKIEGSGNTRNGGIELGLKYDNFSWPQNNNNNDKKNKVFLYWFTVNKVSSVHSSEWFFLLNRT